MSSLANQQQNLSFPGLLQVPGGITSTLQQVQDGNGNPTGLSLSSAGASVTTSSTFVASNNGSPYTGTIARLISDGFGDSATAKDFGATGNGSTNDRAAFAASDSALAGTIVPTGTYLISSSLTFTHAVTMMPGASFVIPTGVVITFNGGFEAGIQKVFTCTGTGAVVFNPQYVSTGYPEWWGAETNNGAIDCSIGINACIVACRITQLQCNDYYTQNTVYLSTPHRTLVGLGWYFAGVGTATRIVILNGSLNVVQMGPTNQPATINDFMSELTVENLQVGRSMAPIKSSGCAGIKNQFTLYAQIKNVYSTTSMRGFHYAGTVVSRTSDCWATRDEIGTGVGSDYWWGFYVDGISYNIGASGGNASIYFNNNNSSPHNDLGKTIQCVGFYLNTPFTDCYIDKAECNACTYGIAVIGDGSTSANYSNIDLMITNPVIDVFILAGIYFYNVSEFGAIEVTGGYCAPQSGTSSFGNPIAGLYFQSSLASILVKNFQVIATPSSTCGGIAASDSKNIETQIQIIGPTVPAINILNTSNSRFLDHVTKYGGTTTNPCVQLSGTCTRNYLGTFLSGITSAFGSGYTLIATSNGYNELNCTGLDPAAISGGSANKLLINSVSVTAVGLSGTNYASGVMA